MSLGDSFRKAHPITKGLVVALLIGAVILLAGYLAYGEPFKPVPEIGQSASIFDPEAFDRRVRATFPPGGSATKMENSLRADGFRINTDGSLGYAFFIKNGVPCMRRWEIFWEAKRRKIVAIKGIYGYSCL